MALYARTFGEGTIEDFKRIEEAFQKLDRRERPFKVYLSPTAGSGDNVAILSGVATGTVPMASISFGPGAPATSVRPSASAQVEYPRIGKPVNAFFEIGYINQVAGGGQNAVFRYRFVYLGVGATPAIEEEYTRVYAVSTTALVYGRDRIQLRAENIVAPRLIGVYITRMTTDAADNYKAGGSATRQIHIVDTRFMLQGADGEDE